MEYRKELKYMVTPSDFLILNHRLPSIMKIDSNIKKGDTYHIRSIYFDDYYDTYFHENESGVNERFKMRIRIYDKKDKLIKLEIKSKINGLTKKEDCSIDKDLCKKIISGKNLDIKDCKNKVLYKLYLEQRTKLLKPKAIVEYERTAWVNEIGNVRVTFDRNIKVSKNIELFFEEDTYAIPLLEEDVLEVKYDELIPDYIANCLELNHLSQTAFSKYYLSRLKMKEVGYEF